MKKIRILCLYLGCCAASELVIGRNVALVGSGIHTSAVTSEAAYTESENAGEEGWRERFGGRVRQARFELFGAFRVRLGAPACIVDVAQETEPAMTERNLAQGQVTEAPGSAYVRT